MRKTLATAALALLCVTSVPAASAATGEGPVTAAQQALRRAQAVFAPIRLGAVARRGPRDATMILRDLALRLGQLSPGDRRAAVGLLARPTDPYDQHSNPSGWGTAEAATSPECGPHTCVHWTDTGTNAPDPTDGDLNGYPDWVDSTLAAAEHVWSAEVTGRGYRAPLSDLASTDNGGDARLDIYLSDVGADYLYGYCTSDDPKLPTLGDPGVSWDVSAFCVVDNNYAESIFQNHTAIQNLEVTLAHEFFHAAQFAYDFGEDRWLMEGTATWMEDQVYDHINDNRQYLSTSQLTYPWVPLDRTAGCCFQYGSWIWFRYLSETLGADVVREIWERADGSALGPDDYSTQAVQHVLKAHGTTFRDRFGTFAAWNRIPARRYSEGNHYPTPPASGAYRLGTAHRSTGWLGLRLKHMSSVYLGFRPSRSGGRRAHLNVQMNGPARAFGPEGRVIVFLRSGAVRVKTLTLDRRGNGGVRVGFGRGHVTRVVLVMSNASARFACWHTPPTQYSCQGVPRDDDRAFAFRARVR
jgi:hypothetical protein